VALIEEAGHTADRELRLAPNKALVSVAANCSYTPKPGGCGPINTGDCASHCSSGDSAAETGSRSVTVWTRTLPPAGGPAEVPRAGW
jgi:hypothetical protein